MQKQQKSESDLLKTYTRIITLTLVLVVIAVIGTKHFSSVDSLSSKNIELEHTRLLYVIAMVKSQWLNQGQPDSLKLNWENMASGSVNGQLNDQTISLNDNIMKMSEDGWPIPKTLSTQGCKDWWQQLMASKLHDLKAEVNYQSESEICHFATEKSGSISYQISTGRVMFIAGSD